MQLIGLLLVIGGVLSLVFAAFSYEYYTETTIPLLGTFYTYPYENYAFPLALLGIILLIFGLVFLVAKLEHAKTPSQPAPPPPPPS
jgi:uncharacterized membrane protein